MNGDVKYVQSIVKLYWIIGFIKKDKKVDRVILPFLFSTSWNGANRSVVVPRRREFIAVIDRATDGLISLFRAHLCWDSNPGLQGESLP